MLFNFQGPAFLTRCPRQTALLLYHAVFKLSIGFLRFFQRFFFRKTWSLIHRPELFRSVWLPRVSLIIISHCFVFVNRFFKIFLSGFSEEKHHSLQPISRSFVQSVWLPRVSLYILSRPILFVNTFFSLWHIAKGRPSRNGLLCGKLLRNSIPEQIWPAVYMYTEYYTYWKIQRCNRCTTCRKERQGDAYYRKHT